MNKVIGCQERTIEITAPFKAQSCYLPLRIGHCRAESLCLLVRSRNFVALMFFLVYTKKPFIPTEMVPEYLQETRKRMDF